MRSLHANSDYFQFLDSLGEDFTHHPGLASMMLTVEFPVLKLQEAKAIYCDWRHSKQRAATLCPFRPHVT